MGGKERSLNLCDINHIKYVYYIINKLFFLRLLGAHHE